MYHSLPGDFESPQAEEFYIDVLRRMTPEQKWQAAINLWELTVETARANLRVEHPNWPEAQIRATVAGSWASTTYGAPRATHDLDVNIAITSEQAVELAAAFPPPFYADTDWRQAAAAEKTFFKVIDPTTGLKVDFWPAKSDEYSRVQFERRRQQALFNRTVWMLAPEDVILYKLRYRASESETQRRDCVGIWKARRETLDQVYLRQWAQRLKIDDLLTRVTAA